MRLKVGIPVKDSPNDVIRTLIFVDEKLVTIGDLKEMITVQYHEVLETIRSSYVLTLDGYVIQDSMVR